MYFCMLSYLGSTRIKRGLVFRFVNIVYDFLNSFIFKSHCRKLITLPTIKRFDLILRVIFVP